MFYTNIQHEHFVDLWPGMNTGQTLWLQQQKTGWDLGKNCFCQEKKTCTQTLDLKKIEKKKSECYNSCMCFEQCVHNINRGNPVMIIQRSPVCVCARVQTVTQRGKAVSEKHTLASFMLGMCLCVPDTYKPCFQAFSLKQCYVVLLYIESACWITIWQCTVYVW